MFRYLFLLCLICGLSSCLKDNFYEDVDDPGISRFTYYGYNVSSAYINGEPWVRPFRPSFLYNGGAARLDIYLQETSGQFDSLHINLPGQFATDALFAHGPWREAPFLRFSVPVKKNFTSNDFLAMAGKVFPQPGTMVTMSMGQQAPSAPDAASVSGTGKIYFVRLERAVTSDPQDEFSFSGLFEGNIGDSILVSKGRFDYKLRDTDNNIPR